MIVGGEDLTEKAARQAKLLEESEKDLEERTKHEARIKKELQEKEVRLFLFSVKISNSDSRFPGRNARNEREIQHAERRGR